MKKLGCLVVIAVLALCAFWAYRTGWIRFGRPTSESTAVAETWQSLTPDGAVRAQVALQKLASPSGPVYVTIAPGDLAAFIFQQLSSVFPRTADSIQAAAIGDRLYVRAIVPTKDLGGSTTLGPLAALMGDHERVQLGGFLHIVRPGFAELQVKEVTIGNVNVPQALIPRLLQRITPPYRQIGQSADGLPLQAPAYIADVRVSNGKVTLYKIASAR